MASGWDAAIIGEEGATRPQPAAAAPAIPAKWKALCTTTFPVEANGGKAPENPPNPKPPWNTIKGVPGASHGKPGKKPIEK